MFPKLKKISVYSFKNVIKLKQDKKQTRTHQSETQKTIDKEVRERVRGKEKRRFNG